MTVEKIIKATVSAINQKFWDNYTKPEKITI